MKIGVMSDSHDNLPLIRRAIERLQAEGAECLIHAGDFVAPFAVREILKFHGPVYGCFGNNDGEKAGIRRLWPQVCEPPCELLLGGRQILLVHDDTNIDLTQALHRPDILISGHSHQGFIRRESDTGPLHVNPGETGGWLTGKSTVALIDTETLEARSIEL